MDLHRAPPAEGHALPAAPSSHEPGDLTDVGLRVGPIRTEPGRLTEQAGVRPTATIAKHSPVMTRRMAAEPLLGMSPLIGTSGRPLLPEFTTGVPQFG